MKNIKLSSKICILFLLLFLVFTGFHADAAGPLVSKPGNKHNLSGSNTGVTYRAKSLLEDPNNLRGQQICIFCHTPHSANVAEGAPLWSRAFSSQSFQRYSTSPVSSLKIRDIPAASYGKGAQPNGSSKLCLSCHDGVSRLGAVYNGPEITMYNDKNVIEGVASFNSAENKMKTGHHPVSFVYTPTIAGDITTAKSVTYQMPLLTQVKLDKLSRMQCTTCHDAHQNMSSDTDCYGGTCDNTYTRKMAPFWVYGANNSGSLDQRDVCVTCHPMNAGVGFSNPWPYPAPP
jgi:cytochrome c551/c552